MSQHRSVDAGLKAEPTVPIGTASMTADGTIFLRLRAEGPGGELGDARFVYAPDDPQYQEILKHVGGLEPGESKPMPPWQ